MTVVIPGFEEGERNLWSVFLYCILLFHATMKKLFYR